MICKRGAAGRPLFLAERSAVLLALGSSWAVHAGDEPLLCDGFETCPAVISEPVLTANPMVAEPGQLVTLSWQLPSLGICSLQGPTLMLDDADLRAASTIATSIADTSQYTLTCSQTASATVTATRPPPAPIQACEEPGPDNVRRLPPILWEDIFSPWGAGGEGGEVFLESTDYVNIQFTPGGDGTVIVSWVDSRRAPDVLRVAVQDCLGSPTPERALPGALCYFHARRPGGTIPISLSGSGCRVELGIEYALSVQPIFEDGSRGCVNTAPCEWNVRTF